MAFDNYLSLYHLKYFIEVARLQSFSIAAEKLNLSQPALSKSVKQLESQLGVKLIDRSQRFFSLTEIGSHFYKAAQLFFHQYQDLLESVKTENELTGSTVKLGVPSSILDALFYDIIQRFVKSNPHIKLSVMDVDSGMVYSALADNALDIGCVMLSPTLPANVEIFPIVRDECYVVLNKSHPLAGQERVSLIQLSGEKFFVAGEFSTLNRTLKNICQSMGVETNIVYQGMMPRFVMEFVSANLGVTVLPLPFIEMYKTKDIVYRPLNPTMEWNVALILTANRSISPAVEYFKDFILQYFSEKHGDFQRQ